MQSLVNGVGQLPLYTGLVLCSLASLLIYCIFGNWIIEEVHLTIFSSDTNFQWIIVDFQASQIAITAYDTHWYEHPPSLRTVTCFLMMRSQACTYFQGLGIIDCSLESFTSVRFGLVHIETTCYIYSFEFQVINLAGSMVAVFHNINKNA